MAEQQFQLVSFLQRLRTKICICMQCGFEMCYRDWPFVGLESVSSYILEVPRQRMFQRQDDVTVLAE